MVEKMEHEAVYVTQTKTTSGLGIAALVLGLIACLGCWIPFTGLLSIPFAAFGIFFGVLGTIIALLTRRSYSGLPLAGTLVSITAIVVAVAISGPLATTMEEIRSGAFNGDSDRADTAFSEAGTGGGIRSSPLESTVEKEADRERQEKEEYIAKQIELNYTVRIYHEGEKDQHPGVVFRLYNKGERALSGIAVTVYLRNSEGKTVHEETFHPIRYDTLPSGHVWDRDWRNRDGTHSYYRIGETATRKAEFIPSEWQPGPNAAYAEISDIEFVRE